MAEHRSFSAARREAAGEATTFDIDGEQFTLRASLPIMPLLDLAAKAGDDAGEVQAMAAFAEFLKALVVEADAARLMDAIRRAGLDYDDLLEIVQWAIPAVVGRPTQRRSASPTPPSTNGIDSNTNSSNAATTPVASY